ncbi:MAG: aspartate ammonia-lyase, partial [Bosea sp.]|nr:aspartate ammonia-lyase [Bosea sp. (in: a-proteobacteria)]
MADAAAATPITAPPQADSVQLATTQTIALAEVKTRRDHDLLGEIDVPADAYWGVHTLRAVGNFPITGVPVGHFPEFVRALALVKQAAARANRRLGNLPAAKADAIERACDLIARDGREMDRAFR